MEKVFLATPQQTLATNVLFTHREPFAEQGLEVELLVTGTGDPIVEALVDGPAGYTHVCGHPLPAAVAGRALKVLGVFQTSSFELYAHPSIKSLKQLEGKSITLAGSITRPNLEIALHRHGLSMESITVAEPGVMRGVDQLHAYERVLDGTVDAISINPPGAQAAHLAGLQCLLRYGDIRPIPTCALLTTDTLLAENRAQVKRFVRALLQSIADIIRDRALGIGLMQGLGIPAEIATVAYYATRGYMRPSGEISEKTQRMWVEWCKPMVGIDTEVPLERVYDFTVLREVRPPG